MKLPLVYVAGPITKPCPLVNAGEGMAVFNMLMDTGKCAPILPHLSVFLHMHRQREHHEWLALDFQYLLRCDAVLRLPGESKGADAEERFCEEHSIPVFTDAGELLDWCERWIAAQEEVEHG